MYCKNCQKELLHNSKFCSYCGAKQTEIVDNHVPNLPITTECIKSIVTSVISFILTTIVRFCVDSKTDLTPEALNYHWGMAVPSNIKPFVIAIPIIFTLITIIKTITTMKMNGKEKKISYVVTITSLIISITVVNMSFEL